jgi:hypothetical protein
VPLRACSLVLVLALPLAARALCTSDRVPQPQAVLERFVSADCEECWRDPRTPVPAANTVVLDWVLPGRMGEDAPLSRGGKPRRGRTPGGAGQAPARA